MAPRSKHVSKVTAFASAALLERILLNISRLSTRVFLAKRLPQEILFTKHHHEHTPKIIAKKHGEYWHNIETCCILYISYDLELLIVHQSMSPDSMKRCSKSSRERGSFRLQGEIYERMQQVHLFAPGFILQSDITTCATESKKEFLKICYYMLLWCIFDDGCTIKLLCMRLVMQRRTSIWCVWWRRSLDWNWVVDVLLGVALVCVGGMQHQLESDFKSGWHIQTRRLSGSLVATALKLSVSPETKLSKMCQVLATMSTAWRTHSLHTCIMFSSNQIKAVGCSCPTRTLLVRDFMKMLHVAQRLWHRQSPSHSGLEFQYLQEWVSSKV